MADDAGDWFGGGEEAPKAAESAAPPEPDQQPEEAPLEDDYLDPDKFLIFKHWIRPKFVQYRYLYDYRRNYYDDVIDYLDKRQWGFVRDIPRPQTWAERALRTYNSQISKKTYVDTLAEDTKLCTKIRLSGAFHSYHTREYLNRKYFSIL